MAMLAIDQPAAGDSEAIMDGSLPQRLTYDPTQSTGTKAWQMSLEHNRQLHARESQ